MNSQNSLGHKISRTVLDIGKLKHKRYMIYPISQSKRHQGCRIWASEICAKLRRHHPSPTCQGTAREPFLPSSSVSTGTPLNTLVVTETSIAVHFYPALAMTHHHGTRVRLDLYGLSNPNHSMIIRLLFLSKSPSWVLSFCHNFNFFGSPVQLLVKDAQWSGLTSDFVPILKANHKLSLLHLPGTTALKGSNIMKQSINPALHLVPGNKYWRIKPPNNSHPLSSRPPNHNQAKYRKKESVINKCCAEGRCSLGYFFFFWDKWSGGKNRGTMAHLVLWEPRCPFQLIFAENLTSPSTSNTENLFLLHWRWMPLHMYVRHGTYGDWIKVSSWLTKSSAFNTFTSVTELDCVPNTAILAWLMPYQWLRCSLWKPGQRKPVGVLPAWMIHPHCIPEWRPLPGASLPVPVLELSLIDTCFGQHLQREKQTPFRLQITIWHLQKIPEAPCSWEKK